MSPVVLEFFTDFKNSASVAISAVVDTWRTFYNSVA